MKQLNRPKNLSDIRVTRKTNVDLGHSGDEHGWAVSYADLLMVLLSFFVLFFSLGEDEEEATFQLRRIAMAMQGVEVAGPGGMEREGHKGQGQGEGQGKGEGSDGKGKDMKSIAALLNMDGIRVTQHADRLVVDLQKSAFRSGDYRINTSLKEQMNVFIKQMQPFQDRILVTVIGHTDDVPMRRRNELLVDNFDLSSIRALRALKYLISQGFPKQLLSARAANSFDRNARSISFEVRIQEKEKEISS